MTTTHGGLRARRTALGLTRQALAERARCSISLVGFLEGGYQSRGPKVQAIAVALDCTVDELFERAHDEGAA